MADYEATEKPAKASDKDDKGAADKADAHAEALQRYERGWQKERKNIALAYEDLRFSTDEGQWDELALKMREGRPTLIWNIIPQFVRQVTGDMRQMRPAIKCVPVDDRAEEEVAEKILPGMMRYIENRSDATGAYFAAADSQVTASIGHLRVLTEYASEDTFNQELRIAAVEDGVAVIWDPDAILPTREDAKWCFVPVDMSRAAFEEEYPDASPDSMSTQVSGVSECFQSWFTDDHVRIAEYWCREPIKRTLALMPNGGIDDLTDAEDDEKAQALMAGARVEKRDSFKIVRHLMTASEIIQTDDWPGPDIPIIPMLGEEIKIGREIVRRGVTRPLKDIQRVLNYAISAQSETVALQPKAPFIGTHTMFMDNQEEWERANTDNQPYLAYKPDPSAPGGKPERQQPPVASTGLTQLYDAAMQAASHVTGIYPASLGAPSNETSGKAIIARQREGDTGTVLYKDNFARALRRVGKILLGLIPRIYDTQRTIRIVGEDGKVDLVQINQPTVDPKDGLTEITQHDVTVGAYDVVLEMGASYATKREEARDGMQALLQALGPQVAPMIADLYVKQQDFPLADKLSRRLQMLLPPAIQQMEAQEAGQQPPPMPPQQQGPSPEQQMEMAKQQQEGQLGGAKLQVDMQKLQVEMAKVQGDLEAARLSHHATMAGHQLTAIQATTPTPAEQPQPDPRVDDLAQTVGQLKDAVTQIVHALTQPQQPVPQADPNAPPGAAVPA